jgi:cytochrome c553
MMKTFVFAVAAMMVLGCTSPYVFAAGEAERGKALFNDPAAFGGKRACSACHPDGGGLEYAAGKKKFHIAGGVQENLEEAVNACIVNAGMGKAIDIRSEQMKEIVAYITSLRKK